jgi:hypothetical protein
MFDYDVFADEILGHLYDCSTKVRIGMFVSTMIGNSARKSLQPSPHQIVRSLKMRKLFFLLTV